MQFPKSWKNNLSDVKENTHNLVFQDHHLIKKYHMYFLNRLSSKEILIAQEEEQTPSRLYYQKKFNDRNLDWNYLLVRIVIKRQQISCFLI